MSQISDPTLKCGRHAQILATQQCVQCAMPLCDTCARPQRDGTYKCPLCSVSVSAVSPRAPVPEALRPRIPVSSPLIPMPCAVHSEMKTTVRCDGCGSYVCETCDFKLENHLHVCPTCAMSSPAGLSSSRKKLVIAGILLALWGTIGMVLMFTGYFADTSEEAAGMAFVFLIFFPTLIGFGVSLCAQESRLQNPAAVWVAIIWNTLIMLVFIGLIVVGNLMKA